MTSDTIATSARRSILNKSLLTRLLGHRATLIHGDPLILDRWLWLKRRLPKTRNGEELLDVGCGSGAFSIGSSLRGYTSIGVSWDERNQNIARERAKICRADTASFEVLDVRHLDKQVDWLGQFDVVVNFENIEHILDDRKLQRDIANCLKPGGRLLLTTPYYHYRAITPTDSGPFRQVEDGGHVRRGYTKAMLEELCAESGLVVERISFCSGFISQKLCMIQRTFSRVHPIAGWAVILPFRLLPPVLDRFVTRTLRWPHFSICLEAYKPRFSQAVDL